jgi:hypothetical protein
VGTLQNSARYTRFVRGVGVVGVVGNSIGVVDAARHGDVERVVTGTTALAGSALMFTPAAPVGAALVVGSMVYEHRDAITQGARRARDWAGERISNGIARLNPFGG